MFLKFCKTQPVKSPTRANSTDAGIDLYVPDSFPGVRLRHGESVLIPSGLKFDVPKDWALILTNKSGVASKKHLDVMACVIDHAYKGVIHINLIHNGLGEVIISPGEKIVQAIMFPIGSHALIESTPEDMWLDADNGRGEGGFGSTGT